MDDVKNEPLIAVIERWGFMTLGVFTTCCFTKDFAALDLLRFPQTFAGIPSGNNIVAFTLPDWLPHEHAILKTNDGALFSKLRELFSPVPDC